jgi:MoxR-like ATPase
MNKQQKIEQIELQLKTTTDPVDRQTLESMLASLKGVATPSPASGGKSMDAMLQLAQLAQKVGGLDDEEVKSLAEKVFASSEINLKQLSPEVIDFIDKNRSTTIRVLGIQTPEGIKDIENQSTSVKSHLFYVIMTDVSAKNNVYLYGSAGTGKSFMAKQIASTLEYKLITINCNQFTSPLEIIGGQTIDAYQEGKLTMAWGNLSLGTNPATGNPFKGAVLLIDELPKLDPNTAGVLNDALSKIKDPDEVKNGKVVPKIIYNGRNQAIPLQNLFVMATGNTLLLRPDPTYTANFAQDASLQDRFAGSTYRVYYNYEIEYNEVLTLRNKRLREGGDVYDEINFAFLFNFLIKMREAIDKLGYNNEAFISARIMGNLRDTYLAWYLNKMEAEPIPEPKTLADGIQSFIGLFTQVQQQNLQKEVDYENFINNVLPDVEARPLDALSTPTEKKEAEDIVKQYKANFGNKIF